jgi:hypothetical protein
MPNLISTAEVNRKLFQCFSPNMSDEDDESWDETGAFPSGTSSSKIDNHHVFADEPFEGDYYSSLQMVPEGSKKETRTGAREAPRHEELLMTISTSSSDHTPAVDNTAEASLKKKQQQQPLGIQQSSSMNYPYNIYQSLSKEEKERKERDDLGSEKPNTRSLPPGKITKNPDREESSTPPVITPLSFGDDSSVMTDPQSHLREAASTEAPHSAMSNRSRRQGGGKRYTVRHTLSTSQQVNANPATMLKHLFIGIEQERHMHKLAALNLRAVHNWLLFLPAILLTLLSGAVALVFEADLNTSSDIQIYSSIFVGVTALISVFWQALGKQLDLGIRGALHDVTAGALKRLSEDVLLTLSSTEANIPAEYVALIGEKFGQALDAACPSTIPHKLETAFSAVSDRMELMLKPPMGQAPRKYHVHKLDFMRLYATAYDELTSEIIHYWAWPFAFPQPREASDRALRNFKAIITEGRENSKKKGCLAFFWPCWSDGTVERSLFDIVPAASSAEASGGGFTPNYNTRSDPYLIRNHMLGAEI